MFMPGPITQKKDLGIKEEEMIKIFDFLIENGELIISDNGLFSFDTLKMIRAIMKGKIPNNFKLTEDQKQLIIETFIHSNQVFNKETLNFLLTNESCIKASIDRDINSIDFLLFLPPDLEDYIIEKAKKEHYILKENSCDSVRSCYEIALNSIQTDVKSADFVLGYYFFEEKRNVLIDTIVKNGYILSENSASFLKENKKVVFSSIQKNVDSFLYADESMKKDYFIMKYLLFHGYDFSEHDISQFPLKFFSSPEFMNCCLKKLELSGCDDEKYINRITKIYSDALRKLPSISTFQSVFESVAELSWKEYRKENAEKFDNIFGIICAEIKEINYFDDVLSRLTFLQNMEIHLGKKKYNILLQAMNEYFYIIHSEVDDKLSKIQNSKNKIAELSALYVSKAKENYKKEELDTFYDWIKPYFALNMNHPMVQKKIKQNKQKAKFKYLYENGDKNTTDFLEKIAQKYENIINRDFLDVIIKNFVKFNASKLNQIIDEPDYYSDYVRCEKAIKLIRRLNSGFIQYDGPEMTNYRDIICYSEIKEEYNYHGPYFTEQQKKEMEKYKLKLDIFEKIKREITSKTREMEVDEQIDASFLVLLKEELPFTEEYFIFDSKNLKEFNLYDLSKHACLDKLGISNFKYDSIYNNIYQLLVDNGMIWLLLFMSEYMEFELRNHKVNELEIISIINHMGIITSLSRQFHFDLKNFQELLLAYEMSKYATSESLAILGNEVVEKIYKHQEYISDDPETIISMATKLAAQMVKRNLSTVPYIEGETPNYKYSLYDSQDETLLLAGINTDACFRVGGNDNEFLHYCALDKNGFVIKITDHNDNFIARASGFRNGNCVFINQLRTIYDRGGYGYEGNYEGEQNDIIETFQKACEDIIAISQKNEEEIDKIDHVFVTQSYSFEGYPNNVPNAVEEKIGDYPMESDSEDWTEFVENTQNIDVYEEGFITDYGNYSLICMASIKEPKKLEPKDIKCKNVNALYERKRTPIMIINKLDSTTIRKINKIRGIKLYFERVGFESIEIPKDSTIIIGDNWYMIYNNGCIIDSCLLDFDKKAKMEFEATALVLKKEKINGIINQQDIDKIMDSIQVEDEKDRIKIKVKE